MLDIGCALRVASYGLRVRGKYQTPIVDCSLQNEKKKQRKDTCGDAGEKG